MEILCVERLDENELEEFGFKEFKHLAEHANGMIHLVIKTPLVDRQAVMIYMLTDNQLYLKVIPQ